MITLLVRLKTNQGVKLIFFCGKKNTKKGDTEFYDLFSFKFPWSLVNDHMSKEIPPR